MKLKHILPITLLLVIFSSCKKDPKVVPNNNAPYYDGVSTVKIENYVNRLFIDLIGREALNVELSKESAYLKDNHLSIASREVLITKLQSDSSYLPGDSSYRYAYYNRLYELTKARLLEGASKSEFLQKKGENDYQCILDSTVGDSLSFKIHKEISNKLVKALKAQTDYMRDSITINQFYVRLLDNAVYDQINMNSFNFIRATFNDLFFRYPTNNEFSAAYDMVDTDIPAVLFGKSGQSKSNYLTILTNSSEYYEGMVRWAFQTFLSRQPTNQELGTVTQSFYNEKDLPKIQRNILKSDEYANF